MRGFFKLITIGNEVLYGIEFSLEDVQQLYAADFLCVGHRPALMLSSLLGLLGVLSLSASVLEPRMRRLRAIKLFRKEWYKQVTAEELATVKAAMVGDPAGIVTHSGHWYNCANGHLVSPYSLFWTVLI